MAPTRQRFSSASAASPCASPAPASTVVATESATTTSSSPPADEPLEQSAQCGVHASSERKGRDEAVTTTATRPSFLTPLVADHVVLATPLPVVVNGTSSSELDGGAREGPDCSTSSTAVTTAEVKNEEAVGSALAPKRSPRALFGSLDGAEGREASHSNKQPNETASSRTASEPLQLTSEASSSERKRAKATPTASKTTTATLANACDGVLDAEAALVLRKKWKRSLPPPAAAASHPLPTTGSQVQPPSRSSFVRSMSSQSIFLTKPSEAAPSLVLPTTPSTAHPDLNVISPETVARLLRGDFAPQLARHVLVDCRFSYEFAGGSVKTAQSLSDPASVEQRFLRHPPPDCARTALVFFCEFSATRAPKMLRHVRNLDRWLHAEQYPTLFYPELYLIDGGYKKCFETTKEICSTLSYTPMNHEAFTASCKREFREWRRHWKAHTTSACAGSLQLLHRRLHEQPPDSDRATATADEPLPLPPLALRSLSELL